MSVVHGSVYPCGHEESCKSAILLHSFLLRPHACHAGITLIKSLQAVITAYIKFRVIGGGALILSDISVERR